VSRFNIYDRYGNKTGEIREEGADHYYPSEEEIKRREKEAEWEEREKRYKVVCWIIGLGIAVLMWVIPSIFYSHYYQGGKTEYEIANNVAKIILVTIIGSFIMAVLLRRKGVLNPLSIIFLAIALGNIVLAVLGLVGILGLLGL